MTITATTSSTARSKVNPGRLFASLLKTAALPEVAHGQGKLDLEIGAIRGVVWGGTFFAVPDLGKLAEGPSRTLLAREHDLEAISHWLEAADSAGQIAPREISLTKARDKIEVRAKSEIKRGDHLFATETVFSRTPGRSPQLESLGINFHLRDADPTKPNFNIIYRVERGKSALGEISIETGHKSRHFCHEEDIFYKKRPPGSQNFHGIIHVNSQAAIVMSRMLEVMADPTFHANPIDTATMLGIPPELSKFKKN